jgi:adenylate kinase
MLRVSIPVQNPGDSDDSLVPNNELEIKDAPLIFGQVWRRLEQDFGRPNLRFPKEIMWLGGAPGAGKGTNTPFIMRERSLTAPPIVMSDLLDTAEMQALKDQGKLVGDREVIDVLLRQLLKSEYESGVVVDGFPRTKMQVEAVKLLHDRMLDLRAEFYRTPIGPEFRRPLFRITVLFVDEQTSVERQLQRGVEIERHNQKVKKTGIGRPVELRPTDVDEDMARNRYRTFKEQTYEALTSLRKHFHYHFINAQAPLDEVEANIINEFQYQSSLELGHGTYDIIHHLPVASEVIIHARQELVRRLDNYEHRHTELFRRTVAVIESEFVPAIRRHALAGRAHIKTENAVFTDPLSIDMAIDALSERGYRVTHERQRQFVPKLFEPETGRITCAENELHSFLIRFHPPEIRRGH